MKQKEKVISIRLHINTAEPVSSAVICELFASVVASVEFFDTAASSSLALVAGEERMAFGANVNAQFRFYATSHESSTASAGSFNFIVFRLDFFLHSVYTSLRY